MQIRMDEKGRVLFMATYVISDIHGEYERFMELLEEIELKDTDTLYVLGDVLDRGEHPIKVILKLMEMPNAFCIVGNHEVMALECLRFLCQEITDLAIEEVDAELLDNLVLWKYNGGDATIREFRALGPEMREEVLNFWRISVCMRSLQWEKNSICWCMEGWVDSHRKRGSRNIPCTILYGPDQIIRRNTLRIQIW